MAGEGLFHDRLANPLLLSRGLKKLGVSVLGWAPETLMSALDQKFSGWNQGQVAEALEYFHKNGTIKSDIPQLVREKIYAIRVVATSNSAQTEWHVFEKVGGAFNDRTAKFGVVEPLSAAECARTIAVMENVRPDTYQNEIKIYIAASCHHDGLLTVSPLKWLSMADQYLQQMNRDSTGESLGPALKDQIVQTFEKLRSDPTAVKEVGDDLVSVQAAKLAAIHAYAEEITLID